MRKRGGDGGSKDERPRTSCSSDTRDIMCPFFRRHSAVEIRCEAVQDRCRTCLLFERAADKALHQAVYCEARYACCEIYRMLMREKYDD